MKSTSRARINLTSAPRKETLEEMDPCTEGMDFYIGKMALIAILIGIVLIPLNCFTIFLSLLYLFKSIEEILVEIKEEEPLVNGKHSPKGIYIKSSKGSYTKESENTFISQPHGKK